MKITVKQDHLNPLVLLISSYQIDNLTHGLILEPSLTTGTLTKLSKIKAQAAKMNGPVQVSLEAVKVRNGITQESFSDQLSDNFKKFIDESNEILVTPVELEFEPVDAAFIDNIVISESKLPGWAISNIEFLSELLDIIKGEYVFPEGLKLTEAEVVE